MTRHLLTELSRRYGFPEGLFQDYALVEHDNDVFITTPEVAEFRTIKPVRKGLRLARTFPHGTKPTTNAMQLLGRYATRNVVDLHSAQALAFIQGQTLELAAPAEPGFVIVRSGGFCLGVGLYRSGLLKSQVPRSRRTQCDR